MELLPSLLLLLVVSRIFGSIFKNFGLPDVVGEIIAGLLLGPSVLHAIMPSPELSGIAELAIFLVIFSAGLEMETHEITDALKGKGLLIALFGFFTPILLGGSISLIFGFSFIKSLFFGLILAITALPVVLRFCNSMGLSDSPLSHTAVGAAIIIDIAALLVLGIMLDAPNVKNFGQAVTSIGITGGKMVIFFLIVLLSEKAMEWIANHWETTGGMTSRLLTALGEEGIFGAAVLFVLAFSTISDLLGFHFVIGAFFGGLLLSKDIVGHYLFRNIEKTLNSISSGFLAPVFFGYVGLQFSQSAFKEPILLFFVLGVGLSSKTLGVWIGAKLAKFKNESTLVLAVLLNGRGVMDLVVADIARQKGIFNQKEFSAFVLLAIVSTLIAPMVLKKLKVES
tara:strand:- start:6527 stop:7714 length:1188 start_codon:yes stop_codon:yes gene_type:complete